MCDFVCSFLSSIPCYSSISPSPSTPTTTTTSSAGFFSRNGSNGAGFCFQSAVYGLLSRSRSSFSALVLSLKYMHQTAATLVTPPSMAMMPSADPLSVYRIYVAALVTATKYLEDNTFTNKAWAEITAIPLPQLNLLEMNFLFRLDFNIHVPEQQYSKWLASLLEFTTKGKATTSSAAASPAASPASTPAPSSPMSLPPSPSIRSPSQGVMFVPSPVSISVPVSNMLPPFPGQQQMFCVPSSTASPASSASTPSSWQPRYPSSSPEEILSSLKRKRSFEAVESAGVACRCSGCQVRNPKLVKLADPAAAALSSSPMHHLVPSPLSANGYTQPQTQPRFPQQAFSGMPVLYFC